MMGAGMHVPLRNTASLGSLRTSAIGVLLALAFGFGASLDIRAPNLIAARARPARMV